MFENENVDFINNEVIFYYFKNIEDDSFNKNLQNLNKNSWCIYKDFKTENSNFICLIAVKKNSFIEFKDLKILENSFKIDKIPFYKSFSETEAFLIIYPHISNLKYSKYHKFLTNYKIAEMMLTKDPSNLQFFPLEIKNDKNLVKIAVKSKMKPYNDNPSFGYINLENPFAFSSENLRSDEEFMKEMVQIHYSSFSFASEKLKKNKEFIMDLLKIGNKKISKFIPKEMLDDREILLFLLENESEHFNMCDNVSKWFDDDEISKKIIYYDCGMLKYLNPKYKKDRELILKVSKKNYYSNDLFNLMELKQDKEIINEILKKHKIYFKIEDELKYDEELFLTALKFDVDAFKYTKVKLNEKWYDKLIEISIQKAYHGTILENIPKEYHSKMENIKSALIYSMKNLHYVNLDNYKNDKVFLREIYRNGNYEMLLNDFPEILDDQEFILSLFRTQHSILKHLPKKLTDNEDFLFELMLINPKYIPKSVIKSQKRSFFIRLLKRERKFIQHFPREILWKDLEIFLISKGMYFKILDSKMNLLSNVFIQFE